MYGAPGAKIFKDYQEMLEMKDLDSVSVCTPNKFHAPITIAALKAGKHVFCEKPMAITAEEADKMVKTAKETGLKLSVGYQSRFSDDAQLLKQMISSGELGEIYYSEATSIRRRGVPTWGVFLSKELQGGGPLIDIGTHALDLTLWMMNNYKPKYAVGNIYKKLSQTKNAANAWGPWDPKKFTVEDSAFGFVTMEDGATIILEASWALNILQEGEAKTTLCGTKGGADMWEGLRINGEEFGRLYSKTVVVDAKGVAFYEATREDPSLLEARSWIDAVINNKEPVVKPEEAFVVSQILEAIYESARTGKPVYFD